MGIRPRKKSPVCLLLLVLLAAVSTTEAVSRAHAIWTKLRLAAAPIESSLFSRRVANSRQCYTLCQRTSPCLSLTFDPQTGECALYGTTFPQGTPLYTEDDVVWYAEVDATGQQTAPLALSDGCGGSTCGEGHVCVKDMGPLPTACLPVVTCGAPSGSPHARVTFTSTFAQSEASYACDVGYTFQGTSHVIVCDVKGKWSVLQGQCVADCGLPLDLPAASVSFSHTLEGATATYVCDVGYSFMGDNSSAVCLSNGTWDGPRGNCYANCSLPPEIPAASVSFSHTLGGAVATYTCDVDHVFMGDNSTAVCLSDGTWEGPNGLCLANCSLPPDLPAASVSYTHTLEGATATYVCDVGYSFRGDNSTAVCLSDGSWDGPNGSCLADCSLPPDLPAASVSFTHTLEGATATYVCDVGYSFRGENSSAMCLSNGTWDGPRGNCYANCSLPPEISAASVSFSHTLEGAVATYTCDVDHVFMGDNSTAVCLSDGTWEGPNGLCLAECSLPPDLPAASVSFSHTLEGATATYVCDVGYAFRGDNSTAVCLSDGSWEGPNGSCLANCSTPPQLTAASAYYNDTLENDTATYVCDVGYNFTSADSTARCLNNGTWQMPNGTCAKFFCRPMIQIQYSTIHLSSLYYQSRGFYICFPGRVFVGSRNYTDCLANGRWSAPEGQCLLDCGNPLVDNGHVTYTTTYETFNATVECLPGYHLLGGGPNITCSATGQWTPQVNCSSCPLHLGFVYNSTLDFCYKFVTSVMSWAAARQNCLASWSDLAIANTTGKFQLLHNAATASNVYTNSWLGGAKDASGLWQWVDGSEAVLPWLLTDPHQEGEDCLGLAGTEALAVDLTCSSTLTSFCQFPPPPS